MSLRFRICLTAWILVIVWAACTDRVQAQDETATSTVPAVTLEPVQQLISDDEWVMEITPARKVAKPAVEPTVTVDADGKTRIDAAEYRRIYNSIPFNRAEYDVNPSYRHDTAMEILTGNARHQTVVRHQPTSLRRPAVPSTSAQQLVVPYGFVRPSLRLNYYRHFPSLNPYWNMFWNYSGIR